MRICIWILILIIGLSSCKKDSGYVLPQTSTSGTVIISLGDETIAFEVKDVRIIESKCYIRFNKYNSSNVKTLSMAFGFLELTPGKQFLNINKGYNTYGGLFTADGDLFGDAFLLNEADSADNFLEFTEVNKERGVLKGIFRGVYIRDTTSEKLYVNLPDTIRITDGRFDLRTKF